MTRTLILIATFVAFTLGLKAQDPLAALVPMPNHVEQSKGKPFRFVEGRTTIAFTNESSTIEFKIDFSLSGIPLEQLESHALQAADHLQEIYKTNCELIEEQQFIAESLASIIKQRTGVAVILDPSAKKADITLRLDPTLEGDEHYRIAVTHRGIALTGSTTAALYRAVTTFDQLLMGDILSTAQDEMQPIVIDDAPRFARRALMLDPARHFLPVAEVEHFIDQMAKYKYNVLQIHLTDDQGWRVAIDSHPRLASAQHYTQDDLRHIVRYAAERHIEVVPEVDIPGHTVAILAAYPELSCSHLKADTVVVGHTTNRMVCAANEKSYEVLTDVIEELAALFPSPYIHLGGDEAAVPVNWAQCTDCQAMMRKQGYTKATQLMTPFFDRILAAVRQNNKKPILWCELDNIYPPANDYLFPYPEDVTLVTWRWGLTPTCLTLTHQHGHPILMAPGEYAYLDYPQWTNDFPEFNNWGMPLSTLENCYKLDPGYGRAAEEQAHVQGVMGTLWAEAIPNIHRATYMAFPRALALAEAGWTEMPHRSWESFKQRMMPNLYDLIKSGVSVRVPYEVMK